MDFYKIGNKYYNKTAILSIYSVEKPDLKIRYCASLVGGITIDLSEEEFNNILGIKKNKRIVE